MNGVDDETIVSWVVFESCLMEFSIPLELREAISEFLTINVESIRVHEYTVKFTQLSRFALEMVADIRSSMSLFVAELSRRSSK